MSEPKNLNFDPHSSDDFQNPAQILHGLEPQPLEISRDELFFQAGFVAGRRGRGLRYFWPSAAAALLLVCMGLGAALIWQAGSISTMQTALAATQHAATRGATAGLPSSDSTVGDDRWPADDRLRQWQRLASAAPLPPGRLTALGWVELSRELGSEEREMRNRTQEPQPDPSAAPEAVPLRPATYLELMRLQREG